MESKKASLKHTLNLSSPKKSNKPCKISDTLIHFFGPMDRAAKAVAKDPQWYIGMTNSWISTKRDYRYDDPINKAEESLKKE